MPYTYDRRADASPNPTLPKLMWDMLLGIDNAPYHALPVDMVPNSSSVRKALQALIARGLVRLVEKGPRFPAHYVLTGGGSHAIRTFTARRP